MNQYAAEIDGIVLYPANNFPTKEEWIIFLEPTYFIFFVRVFTLKMTLHYIGKIYPKPAI